MTNSGKDGGNGNQGPGDTGHGNPGPGGPPPHPPKFEIQIDRTHYTVLESEMTGAQLRQVPSTPIGPDRDLFEVVPGGSDKKILDTDTVQMRNGLRFFTAPTQINPGVAVRW